MFLLDAPGQEIVHLLGYCGRLIAAAVANPPGLTDLPGGIVGDADVPDFAGSH